MMWLNEPDKSKDPRFCFVKSCMDNIDIGPCFIRICAGSRMCGVVIA